uniref:G_PROTEIN_RECEP_F1_2 domain-containing protein n=1 Tax=Heterorhabditis bacteriophora TaxID=37862 RepID=A0A1I7WII3_HETBA
MIAIFRLSERVNTFSYCTLNSNYQRPGDIASTVFLAMCPLISYSIAVVNLFLFNLFLKCFLTNIFVP